MYPVYGMAEATLSISFPRPGDPPTVVSVDRDELGRSLAARTVAAGSFGAKDVVSVGRAVHGMRIRIVDDQGAEQHEGTLGEIQIQGAAVTSGYYRNPEATEGLFHAGWMRTGDVGFRLRDDMFVTGRRKEMIVVNGQNFFPDDVEHVIRDVPGVYQRRCVAFPDSDDNEEYVGVIVETRARDEDELAVLKQTIRHLVASEIGLSRLRVHLVDPRWIPRTTSGKWQRARAAQMLKERAKTT
jgi:acyl-CoA synthetase (AMP-forming)/AMP-acid ligase II